MLQSVYSFITEHCQRHTMLFNEKNIKCNAEFIHVKKFCKIYSVLSCKCFTRNNFLFNIYDFKSIYYLFRIKRKLLFIFF